MDLRMEVDSDFGPSCYCYYIPQVGGVRCWGAERLVSPLLLCNTYNQYKDWCKVKAELDSECVLESGFVQGTVFSKPTARVVDA